MSDLHRRRRALWIADSLLLSWLQDGFPNVAKIVKDAVPKPARIVDAKYDAWTTMGPSLVLLIESPEFSPVDEGRPWPAIEPVFRTIYPAAEFPHPDEWDKTVGLMARAGVEPAGTDYKAFDDVRHGEAGKA